MLQLQLGDVSWSWRTAGITSASLASSLLILYYTSGYPARRAFTKYTAVDDLSILDKKRIRSKLKGTAVIAGGSIAGLLAALPCAQNFEEVLIIETDEHANTGNSTAGTRKLPNGLQAHYSKRSRIMQQFSLHVYQPFMLYAMRRWFPDWEEQVINAGGQICDFNLNVSLSGAEWGSTALIQSDPLSLPRHPNIPSGQTPKHFALTRPFFEPLFRKLVLERYPNVRIVTGTVTGITLDSKKRRVQTATYTTTTTTTTTGTGTTVHQPCAFFIDCTGRGHTGTKWLFQAGLPAPKVITYKSNLRYTTIYFDVSPDQSRRLPIPGGFENAGPVFYVLASNARFDNRCVWGLKAENNRIIVGAGGWGITSDEMPRTPDELRVFCSGIRLLPDRTFPQWYMDMLDILLEGDGWEKSVYDECPSADCMMVEYSKYKHLPDNFIALGDSECQTSPVAGFGCTKSCVSAATLAGMLYETPGPQLPHKFARKYFEKNGLRTGWIWESSKLEDYDFPSTVPVEGETLQSKAGFRELIWRLIRLAGEDPMVSSKALYGRMWLYPPSIMFSNWNKLRALWNWNALA